MPAAALDALAPAYDARFTETALGRILRRAVWRWLDRAFAPGTSVLELSCGGRSVLQSILHASICSRTAAREGTSWH